MSWFQALQVYLLSLFEKLRDPFVLLWFMSVHLEATPSRCSQSCERSVASCGVQQRSAASSSALAQKRPAAGGHINKWTVGTFPFSLMWLQNLQIWVNSKFKDVTCNHRPFLQKKWILAEDLGANWCLRLSLSLKESGIDTWHTFSPHVQWALPDRNVAQPLVRCFLSVVLPHRFLIAVQLLSVFHSNVIVLSEGRFGLLRHTWKKTGLLSGPNHTRVLILLFSSWY